MTPGTTDSLPLSSPNPTLHANGNAGAGDDQGGGSQQHTLAWREKGSYVGDSLAKADGRGRARAGPQPVSVPTFPGQAPKTEGRAGLWHPHAGLCHKGRKEARKTARPRLSSQVAGREPVHSRKDQKKESPVNTGRVPLPYPTSFSRLLQPKPRDNLGFRCQDTACRDMCCDTRLFLSQELV